MNRGNRCTGTAPVLRAWLLVLFCLALAASLSWDADGNPNTDNLPAVSLPTVVQAAADAETRTEELDGEATTAPRRPPFFGPRPRRHSDVFRQWRWRRLALPPRGP